MKVFLTGGTGFVGSSALLPLLEAGFDVRLLARDKERADRVLASKGVKSHDAEVVVGDMRDERVVGRATAGCETTIHCAAEIGLNPSGRMSVFELNVLGARTVISRALQADHDPVVYVSSISIFLPPQQETITASSAITSPDSEYAQSKVETERELRPLQAKGEPITILYPGGVIGPDGASVDATVEALLSGRKQRWPVTSGGISLLDVRDLAGGLVATLRHGRGPRNLMLGGHFLSWADLGDVLDELLGVRARRLKAPRALFLGVGALLDLVRHVRTVSYPLSVEGARIMTQMVPTDDEPALKELDIRLRPAHVTLEDTFRWLVMAGYLDRRLAPRLSRSH